MTALRQKNSRRNMTCFRKLAFSGRHEEQLVWVISQRYLSVLKDLREQTKWICIFYTKDIHSFEVCYSYISPIWRDNNISLRSKVKLMRSLVISIFLYACESWTLTAELEKRTQAFEMRCYRRLSNISYKDHVTNEEVRRKIQAAIGEYDELLTLVKKRKLRWFGHVSRSSDLAKTILQGTVNGKRGRQKKRWEDNIKKWTGMDFASSTRAAKKRSRWKGIVANSSVVPRRPSKGFG